jgi:hypothetical protein
MIGMTSAVRSQGPAVTALAQPAPEPAARVPLAQGARPVTETQRTEAPQQSAATAAAVQARLAERDESDHPAEEARIAAEAARVAYINASREAGISPLPLP